MADSELNIKITAEDKASPALNKTAKSLDQLEKEMDDLIKKNNQVLGSMEGVGKGTSIAAGGLGQVVTASGQAAAAMGGLAGSVGQVSVSMGALIGAGGIGALTTATLQLLPVMLDLGNSFIGWVTGLDSIAAGYDNLDPKLVDHIARLKELDNQIELMGKTGSARVMVEGQQIKESINRLEEERKVRREAVVETEKWLKQFALVPGAVQVFGGRLTKAREALTEVERALEILRKQTEKTDKSLGLETAKEGEKRLKDQARAAKEHAAAMEKLAEANYRQMLQIQDAVNLEQKLFTDWAKDILKIRQETAKAQAEIDAMGLKRLEKSLGTGVTEEAIAGGLEKNAQTAKKIIKDRQDQLKDEQEIWLKLNRQREEAFEKQQQQWERMLDTIREGAGRVFDAMLTKGESVFSSLANFAQGVLQTMLRNVFQNAVQMLLTGGGGRLARIFSGGGQGGANLQNMIAGGGGGAAAAAGGFGGLIPFFARGRGGGANLQNIITGPGGGRVGGFAGFAGSQAGQAMTGGFAIGGQMLMMDAFRRGSAFEGMAGGAMAGMAVGTMIAPGIGTAIGAGVGAIAGLVTGLFGGGAKRRAEEAAKRAAMIEANQFAAPETITRYGTWGGPGEFAVEPDLTGQIRGIGRVPTVVVNVENNMIDARHAREAGEVIGQAVSQQILAGGSYLADNIAWAAGAP
jgi:hypothetical protein